MLFVPNAEFPEEWQASADALKIAQTVAEAAAPIAVSLAPKDTEDLAKSIAAEAAVVDGQATGRVVAGDFKAAWKEFGSRREGPQPFLRPAMESVTGRPVTGGKR